MVPHSRSPRVRRTIWLRFVMSRASARLPYSQPVVWRPMPVTRCSPSRTRSCAHVNETFGPSGISINADRSANVRREKNGAGGSRDAPRASEIERVLIDDERVQAAGATPFVRAHLRRLGVRQYRRRRRHRPLDEFGSHDAPLLPRDGDHEIGRRETTHRPALFVDDADVDGDDLDSAAKRRQLLVGRGLLRRQLLVGPACCADSAGPSIAKNAVPTVTVTTPTRMPRISKMPRICRYLPARWGPRARYPCRALMSYLPPRTRTLMARQALSCLKFVDAYDSTYWFASSATI